MELAQKIDHDIITAPMQWPSIDETTTTTRHGSTRRWAARRERARAGTVVVGNGGGRLAVGTLVPTPGALHAEALESAAGLAPSCGNRYCLHCCLMPSPAPARSMVSRLTSVCGGTGGA